MKVRMSETHQDNTDCDISGLESFRLEPCEAGVAMLHCTQCSHRAVWPFQLEKHVRMKHENIKTVKLMDDCEELELYPCFYCEVGTYFKLSQYEHYTSRHVLGRGQGENIGSGHFAGLGRYACNDCDYKTHSSLFHVKHLESYTSEALLKAQIAQETSRIINSWIIKPENDIQTGDSSCPVSTLKTESSLKVDESVNGEEITWFSCTKCSHRTKYKHGLKTHMLIHASADEIVWFACTKCPYRAKSTGELNRHTLTHANAEEIAWFYCGRCSYRTKRRGTLARHEQSLHAPAGNIKWFCCPHCPFQAKEKGNLKKHMVTHLAAEDVQWFCCDICSYRSKHQRVLKSHMVSHVKLEEIAWYNCAECSYRAKQRRSFNRHVQLCHIAGS